MRENAISRGQRRESVREFRTGAARGVARAAGTWREERTRTRVREMERGRELKHAAHLAAHSPLSERSPANARRSRPPRLICTWLRSLTTRRGRHGGGDPTIAMTTTTTTVRTPLSFAAYCCTSRRVTTRLRAVSIDMRACARTRARVRGKRLRRKRGAHCSRVAPIKVETRVYPRWTHWGCGRSSDYSANRYA